MPFIVEDGTGLPTATSYIAEATADTYHADRGSTQWAAGSQANKEIALIKATDFIDKRFGRRFVGQKLTKAQALEWPRSNAFDRDGFKLDEDDLVPRRLQQACSEYALRALSILDLMPDPVLSFQDRDTTNSGNATQGSSASNGHLQRSKIKADVVEIDKTFATSADIQEKTGSTRRTGTRDVPSFVIPVYPAADLLLAELLRSPASVIRA